MSAVPNTNYQKHCPGCYVDKAGAAVCPYCGYDESAPRSRLFLPHGMVLGGQYRVGKVLGRPGGFGITYLGWDVNLQQRVAIKEFMPRDICARAEETYDVTVHTEHDRPGFDFGKEQFLREARIVAKLDHANVVRVRSYFNANGTAYLVMDYYEGMSLGDYLSNVRRTIEPEVAVPLLMPILEGLQYVHERGVMHRDVKPANIYLASIGKPILLDFGAARQAAAGDLARSISVVLTEGYAPLEQYQRRTPQGPWTDVYGLAATLYRMISGQIPPAALDRLASDPLAGGAPLASVPARLQSLMRKALAVRPADRFQTALEFKEALNQYRSEAGMVPAVPAAPSAESAPSPAAPAQAAPSPPTRPAQAPTREPPRIPPPPAPPPVSARPPPPPPAPPPPLRAQRPPPPAPAPGRSNLFAAVTVLGIVALAVVLLMRAQSPAQRPAPSGSPPSAATANGAVLSAAQAAPAPALPRPAAVPLQLPLMAAVPAGEFQMGDAQDVGDEQPVHRLRVGAFRLALQETTVAQFREFIERSGYDNPRWVNYPCDSSGGRAPTWQEPGYNQDDNFPVVCVSWEDASAYAQWLSRETGRAYRLPTEAEWEYAARAGTGTQHWWGDGFREGYASCAGCPPTRNAPRAVGSYPKNPFGLYDMNGNVREWTCSVYAAYGQGREIQCAEREPGTYIVLRGGSWLEPVQALRVAARTSSSPFRRNVWTGFRVAQDADGG